MKTYLGRQKSYDSVNYEIEWIMFLEVETHNREKEHN